MSATTILMAVYFFPTLLALCNARASAGDRLAAFILNLMFGWTVIGWLFVFFYATSDHKKAALVRQAKDNFFLREESNNNPN